jgi:hypothetical protein
MPPSFVLTQGSALTISGTLEDSAGTPILDQYDGSESLTTQIWPGGNRPASLAPATIWLVPAAGTFLIAITGAATAALYPGVYEGMTRVASGGDVADAFYFTLTVAPAPAGLPAVPTATTITRLAVEVELVDRDSALLLLCGKSTMADGANRFLVGSIGFALEKLGVAPAIPGAVSDADLAKVPNSQFYKLCDLAEYRLLRNLLTNFAQPDQTSGNTKINLNRMLERFHKQMLELEKQYAAYLGTNKAMLSPGSLRVGPAPSVRPWTARDDRTWGGDF